MKLLLLIFAVVAAAAEVVAVPVQNDVQFDNLVDITIDKSQVYQEKPHVYEEVSTVDVTDLINDMRRLHDSASDVIQQVETTLSTLESLMPHSIRKRQTTVDGSIFHGPGGATGRIDLNLKKGGTTYNGNISHGPGGTSYGAGFSHSSGNTNWGADVNRGPGGTSYGANFDRTWNNGRTSLGANIGRGGGGGAFGGITFSHRFKRSFRDFLKN